MPLNPSKIFISPNTQTIYNINPQAPVINGQKPLHSKLRTKNIQTENSHPTPIVSKRISNTHQKASNF